MGIHRYTCTPAGCTAPFYRAAPFNTCRSAWHLHCNCLPSYRYSVRCVGWVQITLYSPEHLPATAPFCRLGRPLQIHLLISPRHGSGTVRVLWNWAGGAFHLCTCGVLPVLPGWDCDFTMYLGFWAARSAVSAVTATTCLSAVLLHRCCVLGLQTVGYLWNCVSACRYCSANLPYCCTVLHLPYLITPSGN